MSIKLMTLVWDRFPGSGSELLVMLKFADYANDAGGNLYPSIARMAEHARLSESQARRVIHDLIDQGWVDVVSNHNGGAPGSTRCYQINVDKLHQLELDTPGVDATPRTDATPSTHARDGSHGCARRVAPMRPNPSLSIRDPSIYSAQFETAWENYPKRAGTNSKRDAFKAWNARLAEGHTAETMTSGVKRYARFCTATNKIGTEFVLRGETFFGPDDPPKFTLDWTPPAPAPNASASRPHSEADIEALARQLGLTARSGESWDQFRARVSREAERKKRA